MELESPLPTRLELSLITTQTGMLLHCRDCLCSQQSWRLKTTNVIVPVWTWTTGNGRSMRLFFLVQPTVLPSLCLVCKCLAKRLAWGTYISDRVEVAQGKACIQWRLQIRYSRHIFNYLSLSMENCSRPQWMVLMVELHVPCARSSSCNFGNQNWSPFSHGVHNAR